MRGEDMFCSKCGKQLEEGSKFCNGCGSHVNKNAQPESSSKRKTVFDGEIHKCPNCGSQLNAFEHKCKDCGYELRGSIIDNVVKEFADKLEGTNSVNKKNELISNFYIPNTKEDIYEFFILAISNLTTDVECAEAWKSKLEQTYHKAKLSFGNTSEFEYIDKLYARTMRNYRNQSINRNFKKGWKNFAGALLLIIGIAMLIFGFFKGSESGDEDSPFYMVSLIGMLLLISSPLIFTSKSKKKETCDSEDEENDEE
jgi:hypothetical protein